MNRCCPNAVKESRSERVGFYRNEQGGFACLALMKITLSLHQCQRSQRRSSVYREGTFTGKQGRTQSMQCTIWCMIMTWQYAVIWANASSYELNEVGLSWFEPKVQIQIQTMNSNSALSCFGLDSEVKLFKHAWKCHIQIPWIFLIIFHI